MSYNHGQPPPQLGATFVPGGFDDYYMPAPAVDVISPAPQRIMPEVPENMQENIAHLELEANGPRGAMSPLPAHGQSYDQYNDQYSSQYNNQSGQHFDSRSQSYSHELAPSDAQDGNWPMRQQSISQAFKQPPNVQPQPIQQQHGSHDYNQFGVSSDIPNFSIFPKLRNRGANVPPSDDEKEAVLENARLPVLNSNDPEMQLAWAQDALNYVDVALMHEQKLAETQPARPATPQVEHQLRVDAMNVVVFLAEQRHPKAQFMRGQWLEFGKFGLRADKKEAFRCYSRAAEKGYARALYRMGMAYEQSLDMTKALQHYKQGLEAGDSAAFYRMGMMHLLGQHGQQQDFAKGVQLIKQAAATADENSPQGAYVLGMLYARELPQINVPETFLPFDLKSGRLHIEKAAYLGFAKAQLKMGSAYELCSLGCEFNPTLSMHYNALASRQLEPEADMSISKWFLCGYDGEFAKNEELAYEYARRAAQAGLATAEFALGYFNEIGMNVPVDLEKALEWYEKAANDGNKDAAARIESISKSRTLSKRDHENLAITKIKSQHGSMRGQRPARLQKVVPSLPIVADNSPSEYGETSPPFQTSNSRLPDRAVATTPYPISDQPPLLNTAPSTSSYEHPLPAAPYPVDNGPPRISSARPPMPGGFAPELRASSTRPPSSAFNINPNLYGPNDQYGRGYPSQGPGNMSVLPLRPHSSIDEMGQGRGRVPRLDRQPSSSYAPQGGYAPGQGGYAPGPGSYRQPGGPSVQRPEPDDRPSTAPQPVDIGFVAPDARNKLHKQASQMGPPGKQQPTLPDMNYTRPATAQPGMEGRSFQRPDLRTSTTAPGPGRPMRQDAMPQPLNPSKPAKPSSPQPPNKQPPPPPQQQVAKPAGPKPLVPKPSPSPAPSGPPGKGPKTFDEMGIAQAPKAADCVVM